MTEHSCQQSPYTSTVAWCMLAVALSVACAPEYLPMQSPSDQAAMYLYSTSENAFSSRSGYLRQHHNSFGSCAVGITSLCTTNSCKKCCDCTAAHDWFSCCYTCMLSRSGMATLIWDAFAFYRSTTTMMSTTKRSRMPSEEGAMSCC